MFCGVNEMLFLADIFEGVECVENYDTYTNGQAANIISIEMYPVFFKQKSI